MDYTSIYGKFQANRFLLGFTFDPFGKLEALIWPFSLRAFDCRLLYIYTALRSLISRGSSIYHPAPRVWLETPAPRGLTPTPQMGGVWFLVHNVPFKVTIDPWILAPSESPHQAASIHTFLFGKGQSQGWPRGPKSRSGHPPQVMDWSRGSNRISVDSEAKCEHMVPFSTLYLT